MKLKSFGCSLIFGSDLADDGRHGLVATPSQFTYPALIAKRKGMMYSCHARPGAGNFEILNRIAEQVATGQPAVYVINWTWIDRFSYIDKAESSGIHPYNPWGWRSIMPIFETQAAKIYYRDLHSQMRDQMETLLCMKTAIDLILQNQGSFIMTSTDALTWEVESWCPSVMAWLQNQIKPYVSTFEGDNFINWSRRNDFAISDGLHPLEDAHRAAADLILDHWDQYLCHSA